MKKNNRLFALCMAAIWCIVFGTALHNWSIGIPVGLCMGMAFGLFGSEEDEEDEEAENADNTEEDEEVDGEEDENE